MAQPTKYQRMASFTNLQALSPTAPLPGATVDAELNSVKVTTDQIVDNLALIQRDDGALANGSVGLDQLSEEIEVGWQAPGVWVTATAYVVGNTVFQGSAFYRVLVAHTAGVFATDLAAGKWELIVDLATLPLAAASAIAVTPTGGIASITVQAALAELDSEKAAASHTHPSSAITDSTAAGRSMLSAADAVVQRALLSLGDLALIDQADLAINMITQNIAFTGDIWPAALVSNTNDWSPTGLATASRVRFSTAGAFNITGLFAQPDGTRVVLENTGSSAAVLTANDTASAAANRFLFPRPVVVYPKQSIELEYDGTSTGWRSMAPHVVQPVAAGYKHLRVFNVATPFGDSAPATPNAQIKIVADAITLEDVNGECYRATNVSVTADSAVSGANGLDTGAVANGTWYAGWVIYNPTTNTVAALLSTSATAPTMPSGYTFKARVSWNRTNGSAQFNRIIQIGRRAQYSVQAGSPTVAMPVASSGVVGSVVTPTYVAVSLAAFVPSTAAAVHALVFGQHSGGSAAQVLCAANGNYSTSNSVNPPPLILAGTTVNSAAAWLTLESTSIYFASNATGGAVVIAGWEDNI